jgi:hypothetical protein
MFDWPGLWAKRVPPFPREFIKIVFKMFFNKDIEMLWDMLYRQEKLWEKLDWSIPFATAKNAYPIFSS